MLRKLNGAVSQIDVLELPIEDHEVADKVNELTALVHYLSRRVELLEAVMVRDKMTGT